MSFLSHYKLTHKSLTYHTLALTQSCKDGRNYYTMVLESKTLLYVIGTLRNVVRYLS